MSAKLANTTATNAVPTCRPVKRGFNYLPCPRCGQEEATVSIDLHDLTDPEAIQCRDCDATFGIEEVRDIVAKWQRVLLWIDSAPELPSEEE